MMSGIYLPKTTGYFRHLYSFEKENKMIIKELFEAVESTSRSCERISRAIMADAQDMDVESAIEGCEDLEYHVADMMELLYEIDGIQQGAKPLDEDFNFDVAQPNG